MAAHVSLMIFLARKYDHLTPPLKMLKGKSVSAAHSYVRKKAGFNGFCKMDARSFVKITHLENWKHD